ncbi:Com family DNA-binding transcriptional regulator [Pseudomonas sp. M5A4_2d]
MLKEFRCGNCKRLLARTGGVESPRIL